MDDQRDLRLRVFALETALAALLRSSAVDEDALPRSTARFLEATYAQRRYPALLNAGTPKHALMALEMAQNLRDLANDITQALDRFQDEPPG